MDCYNIGQMKKSTLEGSRPWPALEPIQRARGMRSAGKNIEKREDCGEKSAAKAVGEGMRFMGIGEEEDENKFDGVEVYQDVRRADYGEEGSF